MTISYKITENYEVEIYRNEELLIKQVNNPKTQKPFTSESEAEKWYTERGAYLLGDENESSIS